MLQIKYKTQKPYKIVPDKKWPDIIAIMSRDSVKKYSSSPDKKSPDKRSPDMRSPDMRSPDMRSRT